MTEISQSPPQRILAIDPGTRYMGVAFFVGTDLVRADVERNIRVANIPPAEVRRNIERILERWIHRYQPEVVVIEKLHFFQSRRSRLLTQMVKEIKVCCKCNGVAVKEFAPMAVRKMICKDSRPTRLNVARVIATEHYRWLHRYYEKEAAKGWWRQRYWLSMFDAIALGLACHARHTAKHQKRRAA